MSDRARVLAVDDEPRYVRLLKVNLEAAGYEFLAASNAEEALNILARGPLDLVLLDVRMPGMDGFQLLQELREISDAPVMFLTAMGEEADKVKGLRLGADDYLTKPFSAPELLARVAAVLRRYHQGKPEPQAAIGELRLDLAQRRVLLRGEEVRLSRTEFRLLGCLYRHVGRVVPQDQLIREVWGPGYDEAFEGLRVYVYRLRQKLERDPEQPEYIVTFPGVGYMLQAPDCPAAGK